jgi:hypothetical protein
MLIKTGRAARDKGKEHRYVQRLDVARWLDVEVTARSMIPRAATLLVSIPGVRIILIRENTAKSITQIP